MSNVIVVNNSQVPTFQNEELNKATKAILEYDKNIRMNYFKIADALRWVKGLELYKEDGFKSVSEYASQVFGYEKSTVSRMIKIAEDYLLEDGSSTVFVQEGKDFSISQLREVLALPRGDVVDLVQEGQITPDMTKDQIRAVVKAKKNEKENSDIVVEEEDNGINQSCASATGEKLDNNSDSESNKDNFSVQSNSSFVREEQELKSETPSQNAQEAPESTENSLGYSDTQEQEIALESTENSSGYKTISNNDIDFMISHLNEEEEEEEEEYPSALCELNFFNCKKECSETKKLEEIELDELVYSDIIERLPKELKDYIELAKKEIRRLNHFRTIEFARMDEENRKLKEEISRLNEEVVRLTPIKRRRGRPRKNQ